MNGVQHEARGRSVATDLGEAPARSQPKTNLTEEMILGAVLREIRGISLAPHNLIKHSSIEPERDVEGNIIGALVSVKIKFIWPLGGPTA